MADGEASQTRSQSTIVQAWSLAATPPLQHFDTTVRDSPCQRGRVWGASLLAPSQTADRGFVVVVDKLFGALINFVCVFFVIFIVDEQAFGRCLDPKLLTVHARSVFYLYVHSMP